MKFTIASSILFVLLFAVSCVPIGNQSAPAISPTARSTITKAATATATETPTPEPTATPEAKTYKVCAPENFRDCKIGVEDLLNGDYLKWLQTLSKPFDPTKIRADLQLYKYDDNLMIYWVGNSPHFTGSNKGKEPFRRDVTAGFVQFQGTDYALMPVEFYNPKGENQWLITVYPFFDRGGHKFTIAEQLQTIDDWRKNQTTTVIRADNKRMYGGLPDPLVALSFALHPDMAELTDRFVDVDHNGIKSGDRTALNKAGIILLGEIYPQPIKD